MRTLTFERPGKLAWREAPEPRLEADCEAIVRPLAGTTCDLDQLAIRGVTPLAGPFAFGHECVAEVVEIGEDVRSVDVGQRVVVPFHINCGNCEACRAGLTAHCESVPYGAMYGMPTGGGFGGLFSDFARVPYADSMLVPVPDGADLAALASAGDNLPLALESVAQTLAERPEPSVLILGRISLGLIAAHLAVALGAGRVVYVDDDEQRRALAESLGAESVPEPPGRRDGAFDLAVDAAANAEWLKRAATLLVPEGRLECPSLYFDGVELPLFPMAIRGVHLHVFRGNARPHVPRLLDLVADGTVEPRRVVSEVLPWDDAPDALADPSFKPVFVREPQGSAG